MSRKRQLFKVIQKTFRQVSKQFLSAINKQIIWLLRAVFGTRRRRGSENAGFLLPTVAMVTLVVVLLTTAILFRSFERSKNASNVRVNEAVLQAATPALDRAKAKITYLFADPSLPRAVPSDATLYTTLLKKLTTYSLGDETSVIVGYDLNGKDGIEAPKDGVLESKEIMETAWKFPVDTDNDGKFDSFTLYGIYFRNPPYTGNDPQRKRTPLEARTVPLAGKVCDSSGDTSASLIGGSSWYKVTSGELKKSFFIYTATVPITDTSTFDNTIKDKYQQYKGNQGFSAIELQQDRKQIPLTNNSVVYQDDLDITPGPAFRMNGRLFTNSNFFTRRNTDLSFFQVSSIDSCYYERENGKIIIGGNVATNGAITDSEVGGSLIHLFKDNTAPVSKALTSPEKSTSNAPNEIAYNSQAYAQRIGLLRDAQFARSKGNDPQIVKDNIDRRITKDPGLDADDLRKKELKVYFEQRTRRVPFKEVFLGTSGILKTAPSTLYDPITDKTVVLQGTDDTAGKSNDELRPLDVWIYPTNANTKLTLSTSKLTAIDPQIVDQSPVEEKELGDRILVGNNLPELRWDSTLKQFLGEDVPQDISGEYWKGSTTKIRTRTTRAKQLADLGATERDGYWETSAANSRTDVLDVLGGLRVVTGAGVYSPVGSNLPTLPTVVDNLNTTPEKEDKAPVVWSDALPMLVPGPADPLNSITPSTQSRGHLVMRATAVYHYNKDSYDPLKSDNYQNPIACVSSYYNPTKSATATTDGYDPSDPTKADKSNNGFSYTVSTTTSAGVTRGLTRDGNGLFTTTGTKDNVATTAFDLQERLKYQANLVFPNSQFVNPRLRQALLSPTTQPLSLSEQSAIDSTICALQIADGTLTRDNTIVPDNAIKETAFLDARQIKAIDKVALSGNYDLEIEQRQPLEIRATVLDLDILRKTAITGTWANEYLLPNSGIIYAARDDARADSSDASSDVSATDYKLDPKRRPNAIMLIKGSQLNRGTTGTLNDYRPEEKGLILVTDLPAYVKGEVKAGVNVFNTHSNQEFTDYLLYSGSDWDNNFYKRSKDKRDVNFACRPNDPRLPKCTVGETWRPASVLADAVTLLSPSFVEGYRSDGDFDLRNNRTDTSDPVDVLDVTNKRLKNGFWDNNFVTSRNFTDSTYSGNSAAATVNSSYFNNFVTPIQRRVSFPEYVMEMCFKLNVAECLPTDWYVGYDIDGDGTITYSESKVRSDQLPAIADANKLVAGTTSTNNLPKAGYEKFPRRVAFKRDGSQNLLDKDNNVITFTPSLSASPVALGIVLTKVNALGIVPTSASNALWFTTVPVSNAANPPALTSKAYNNITRLFYSFPPGANATSQPLLEPILQINVPQKSPNSTDNNYGGITDLNSNGDRVKFTRWLPKAAETTFNLVIAAGDTPVRVGNSTINLFETNGGFHNFPRLLENWDTIAANITGSFIQFKRSAYATAPYQALIKIGASGNHQAYSLFPDDRNGFYYHSDSTSPLGGAPYYMPPIRNWGFDVALLSQNPDLFAQRFVTPSTDAPDEYYREVSRDDRWVQALLCSTQETTKLDGFGNGFDIKIDDTVAKTTTTKSTKYALPATQRPTTCPVAPI